MSGVAAIAFAAAFTSCSKSTDLYEGPQEPEAPKTVAEKYETAFESEFGKVNPNVDWGLSAIRNGAKTRTDVPNANMWWQDNVIIPKPVNSEITNERTLVETWFLNHPYDKGTSVNWSDFFVQQVSCTEIGNGHMNLLHCGQSEATKEHVSDFNAGGHLQPGNNNVYTDNTTHYTDIISYLRNSGTSYWEAHNSLTDEILKNYIIVAGATIDPSLKDWYYVGFDYEAHGQSANQIVERDGIYNDWIVRICPGTYSDAYRVFVEDLIATDLDNVKDSDWDFNDAVFDAHFYDDYSNGSHKIMATITLLAAGGTLPLTIGGVDVHEAFGVEQSVMVNTGRASCPIAIFTIEVTNKNIEDIPVIVNGNTPLELLPGAATQKLVGPKKDWPMEKVNIKEVYTNFVNYVTNNQGNWWD